MQNGLRVGYSLQDIEDIVRKEPSLDIVLQSQTALIRRHEQLLLTTVEDRLWNKRPRPAGTTEEDAARGMIYDEGWMDCFTALAELIEQWGDAP